MRHLTILLASLMGLSLLDAAEAPPPSPQELSKQAEALIKETEPPSQPKREALKKTAQEAGMVAYQNGRYAEALAYFDVAISLAIDGDTEFIRGLTLLRLFRPEESREPFRNASLTGTSPTVRESAILYLKQLEAVQGSGTVWASLDVGAGYNTNVGLESTTTATPVASPTLQTTLYAGWSWLNAPTVSGAISYAAFWEEPFSAPSGRFLSQTIRPVLSYTPEAWSLRLAPALQYQIYGSSPFLIRYLINAQTQRFLGRFTVGLQGETGRSAAQEGDYRYLNGNSHLARLFVGFRANALDLQLAYSLLKDNLGDRTEGAFLLPIKNDSHGPSIRVVWPVAPGWEVVGTLSYLLRNYPTLALPGDIKRDDKQFSFYLRISHQISPALRLYGALQSLINRSTLDDTSGIEDKNYSQVMVLGGVTWDILN